MNDTIQGLITAFLVIIPVGGATRILMCAVIMMLDGDTVQSYKGRIKNVLVFIVLAESIMGVVALAHHYFF